MNNRKFGRDMDIVGVALDTMKQRLEVIIEAVDRLNEAVNQTSSDAGLSGLVAQSGISQPINVGGTPTDSQTDNSTSAKRLDLNQIYKSIQEAE